MIKVALVQLHPQVSADSGSHVLLGSLFRGGFTPKQTMATESQAPIDLDYCNC